ncbi:WecB/TagA/CpsF family glycosyltransferase [Cohnella candidum]|uniref:Glycosyltransferase n=1 Tax=Cohnella candidum TaxID=2674991 RepID=A0A3G3K7J1_9BACL|nr:WecB/TagA/CpsF family glycosyltransferase [Cohnella candidum]AYQ75709.1 glycosyltransferase [Cohnella candidum]
MNMEETVRYLVDAVENRRSHRIVTGNPIMLMAGFEDREFQRALKTADLVVPDGAGVVWAARHVGEPVKERVTGFDLMHELLREGDLRGWKVYLLGTTEEIISTAHANLQKLYPGVRFVGYRDGYFTDKEDGAVVAAIREAAPDLLFVARSMSTQEAWLAKYQSTLQVPVMMGVGGSFDVIAGKLKRAPKLFQKMRLEWFYRLLQEPSRYRRMLVLPKFALKVMRDGDKVLKQG